MNNKLFFQKGDISLFFTEEKDRKLIHQMAFEEEGIWKSFLTKKEEFPYSQVEGEDPEYFNGKQSKNKYYLIGYKKDVVGVIGHTYHDGVTKAFELDIWLRSSAFTSKGIGSTTMKLLIERLVKLYEVKTFLIRPWKKNKRAIRAYEKCGFVEKPGFDAADYYTRYLKTDGEGDYKDETYNMVLDYS